MWNLMTSCVNHADGLKVNWLKFWPPAVSVCRGGGGQAVDVPAVLGVHGGVCPSALQLGLRLTGRSQKHRFRPLCPRCLNLAP